MTDKYALHHKALIAYHRGNSLIHDSAVASVVALPDPLPSLSSESGLKRGASHEDISNGSPKKQRTGQFPTGGDGLTDDASKQPEADPKPESPDRTRKPIARDDERKRSRRLFGGLLGTLSQAPTTSTVSKRRQEIEERKRIEARRREAEIAERQEERLRGVQKQKEKEHRLVLESDLKIRHSSELARARFLITEAEPRLVRPYLTSSDLPYNKLDTVRRILPETC